MSTMAQAQPGTAVPPRLLSVPLAVTFLAEFTSLTSFFLLLSVMPMLAAAAGAGSSAAGLITGSLLLGTVAAEGMATTAIRRFGYPTGLGAGAVLLRRVAIRCLPGGRGPRRSARTRRSPGSRNSGRMAGAAVRLPLIFAAATIAAGVLDSFLPLTKGIPSNLCSAALLVQAITATLSRWQAGRHGDRYGHARLLIPALAVAALGMAAMIVLGSPVVLFAGMVLFGAGFGVLENASFALLIEQLPEAKASALWNLAYDAGYGAGPAVFGLICVRTGYPAGFALTGVLILAVVPAALRERRAVASVARPLWMKGLATY